MPSCDTKVNKILNMRKVAFENEEVEGHDVVKVIANDDRDDTDPPSKQVEQEEANLEISVDKKYSEGNFQPLKLDLIKTFVEKQEEDSANEGNEELPVVECIEEKQKQQKNIESHRGEHDKTENEHLEDLKSVSSEEYVYKSPSKMTSPDKMRFA